MMKKKRKACRALCFLLAVAVTFCTAVPCMADTIDIDEGEETELISDKGEDGVDTGTERGGSHSEDTDNTGGGGGSGTWEISEEEAARQQREGDAQDILDQVRQDAEQILDQARNGVTDEITPVNNETGTSYEIGVVKADQDLVDELYNDSAYADNLRNNGNEYIDVYADNELPQKFVNKNISISEGTWDLVLNYLAVRYLKNSKFDDYRKYRLLVLMVRKIRETGNLYFGGQQLAELILRMEEEYQNSVKNGDMAGDNLMYTNVDMTRNDLTDLRWNTRDPLLTPVDWSDWITTTNPGDMDFTGIRQDLVDGGMSDSTDILDRFLSLKKYTSSAMGDELYVCYIKETKIEDLTYTAENTTDYSSDSRRWTIKNRETGETIDTIVTDNPRRAFLFSGYPVGKYLVECEQLVSEYSSFTVTYSVREYMFDTKTGVLLYFDEKTLTNGRGGAYTVTISDSGDGDNWISTGESFNVNVNELGVDIEGTAAGGIERID